MSQGRNFVKEIFKSFIESTKPKKLWGELRGKDHFGTEYYEAPGSSHRQKPRRWFTPVDSNEIQHDLPLEWAAWLRHKRKDPPTEEEIQFNIQRKKNIAENVKNLEMQRNKTVNDTKTINGNLKFPKYNYDSDPNVSQERKD